MSSITWNGSQSIGAFYQSEEDEKRREDKEVCNFTRAVRSTDGPGASRLIRPALPDSLLSRSPLPLSHHSAHLFYTHV